MAISGRKPGDRPRKNPYSREARENRAARETRWTIKVLCEVGGVKMYNADTNFDRQPTVGSVVNFLVGQRYLAASQKRHAVLKVNGRTATWDQALANNDRVSVTIG